VLGFAWGMVFGIRERPQKESRLSKARMGYKFTASLHRWTGRLFDIQDKYLGPSPWGNLLASKIEGTNAKAWEEFQAASYFASIEIVAIFSDRREAEEAHAKLRLNKFGRNYTMKMLGLYTDEVETKWELRIPNKFAARAASILETSQLVTIATYKDDDNNDLSKIIASLMERGVPVAAISTETDRVTSSARDIVVLKENRERAVKILETILSEKIDTKVPTEVGETAQKSTVRSSHLTFPESRE